MPENKIRRKLLSVSIYNVMLSAPVYYKRHVDCGRDIYCLDVFGESVFLSKPKKK